MNEKQSEVEKFFEGLPSDENKQPADIFGTGSENPPAEGTTTQQAAGEAGAEQEEHKNRRHRRWESRLSDKERDLIAREARLAALEEVRATAETHPEIDPRLVQMYGPDNLAASKLHQDLLADFAKKARDEALNEFKQWQAAQSKEDGELDNLIADQLDDIEETFGVDLSSSSDTAQKTRKEFLKFVERVSPKDANGQVTDFADFKSSWEVYQQGRAVQPAAQPTRAKEIADRSMERAGTGVTRPKAPTPGFDGWKIDLGIG